MTDQKKGALALIVANVALLLIMLLHPSGEQMANAGSRFDAMAALGTLVHTLAILALPVLFLGALALTRELASPNRLAVAALVIYGLALLAGLCAGILSGYVAPSVLRQLARVPEESAETWRALFRYTGMLNQAFARVLVVAGALAVALWSLAMRTTPRLRWYGILSSALLILGAASGILRLDVHGYGAVVLLQAIWFILAARMLMMRGPEMRA